MHKSRCSVLWYLTSYSASITNTSIGTIVNWFFLKKLNKPSSGHPFLCTDICGQLPQALPVSGVWKFTLVNNQGESALVLFAHTCDNFTWVESGCNVLALFINIWLFRRSQVNKLDKMCSLYFFGCLFMHGFLFLFTTTLLSRHMYFLLMLLSVQFMVRLFTKCCWVWGAFYSQVHVITEKLLSHGKISLFIFNKQDDSFSCIQ